MNIPKNIAATLTVPVIMLSASGCETNTSTTPEVSRENCTTEKINMINDIEARQKFAGECSRISVIKRTENPKNLLDYAKPQKQ